MSEEVVVEKSDKEKYDEAIKAIFDKDFKLAEKQLTACFKLKDKLLKRKSILFLFDDKKIKQMDITEVLWLKSEADKGNSYAQNAVGKLIFNGHGIKKDYGVALHYYRLSANQGNPHGQFNVGVMFAFLGEHGYYTSMNSFALPLELAKTWDGGEAADSTDIRKIVEYCESDVEILQQVHESGLKQFYLKRRAKGTGKTVVWVLPPCGFRTVPMTLELLKTSMPDQKWMSDPPPLPSGQIQWTNSYRE